MRILITGATSNVSRGMISRLRDAGHSLVLYDLVPKPEAELFSELPYVQGDIQAGIGLDRAAAGCDLIIHTPAWHGIHWRDKTEADFWRLNVDGTFWMFQAAVAAGIKSIVFLSSMAWYGKYDKYGFTKRLGEEMCEYNRRNHGMSYVAIRPHDFTPWDEDNPNRYGARLLYGGVDREDVMDCIAQAVLKLTAPVAPNAEAEGVVVNAVRSNAFKEQDLVDWVADPLSACERIFPGSRSLVVKYSIHINSKPSVVDVGPGAGSIGYSPKRHFGTFIEELRANDAAGGEDLVRQLRCPY